MNERHTVRVAAFAIVFQEDKVLLVRRGNTGYRDGEFGLPSGHIEAEETAPEAIVRELKEETGLNARPEDVEMVHVQQNHDDAYEYVNFYGKVTNWHGTPFNVEADLHSEIGWFPRAALPAETIPYIRRVLEAVERKEIFGVWNIK